MYGQAKKKKEVIPPGIEPGTLSVLDSRDNHYTMESSVFVSQQYDNITPLLLCSAALEHYLTVMSCITSLLQVTTCYSHWTLPLQKLTKSPQDIEERLRDIADNKDTLRRRLDECISEYHVKAHPPANAPYNYVTVVVLQ